MSLILHQLLIMKKIIKGRYKGMPRKISLQLNQAVIQDGRVDIQSKNVGYGRNGNRNAGRSNRNQTASAGIGMVQQIEANDHINQRVLRTESNLRKLNVQCYNCNVKGQYARDCPQPKLRDAKYFREQMLLAMKDEAGGNLNEEENDCMLDNHYGDNSLEELNAAVIMMERIQPTDDKANAELTYDADALGEVNAFQIYLKSRMHSESVHEHTNHVELKTVINTSDDDQIDSSIIYDNPYVENNEHDSNAHDQSVTLEFLIQNVQKEAKNQRSLNNELKRQKALLQKELETCTERVKTLEKQPVKSWNYKEAYEELEREMRVDKDKIDNVIEEKDKIQDKFFNSKMQLSEYDMNLIIQKGFLGNRKQIS
ncbi:retrovirus-related pol polyprotein from transposon TNT 1-94 [Tanacetum coccineum]